MPLTSWHSLWKVPPFHLRRATTHAGREAQHSTKLHPLHAWTCARHQPMDVFIAQQLRLSVCATNVDDCTKNNKHKPWFSLGVQGLLNESAPSSVLLSRLIRAESSPDGLSRRAVTRNKGATNCRQLQTPHHGTLHTQKSSLFKSKSYSSSAITYIFFLHHIQVLKFHMHLYITVHLLHPGLLRLPGTLKTRN